MRANLQKGKEPKGQARRSQPTVCPIWPASAKSESVIRLHGQQRGPNITCHLRLTPAPTRGSNAPPTKIVYIVSEHGRSATLDEPYSPQTCPEAGRPKLMTPSKMRHSAVERKLTIKQLSVVWM
jgi:hypothetical protein